MGASNKHHSLSQFKVLVSVTHSEKSVFKRFKVHISIKGITNDISNDFQFNTVISKYRELANYISDWTGKTQWTDEDKNVYSFAVLSLIKLMSPVAVHMCEEIWTSLGAKTSIHDEKWCEYDENLAKAKEDIDKLAQITPPLSPSEEVENEYHENTGIIIVHKRNDPYYISDTYRGRSDQNANPDSFFFYFFIPMNQSNGNQKTPQHILVHREKYTASHCQIEWNFRNNCE